MKIFFYLFLSLLLTSTQLQAGTMFTLAGVKKVYPVIEISGSKIPKNLKNMIKDLLIETTNDLGINTKGYDQRALAIIVTEGYVNKAIVINIKLLIGEQVTRLDSAAKTFAITYEDVQKFIYNKNDDMEEKVEDSLDALFSKFSIQYKEENKNFKKVLINEKYFAKELAYETDYEKALKRAKKEKKNVMMVMVSNFCPWCRKFEQRVLLKQTVNDLIQKNYIPLIINKEKGNFPKELDMSFTPIVHFISYKTTKSYQRVVGYNNKEDFLYVLRTDKVK